MRSRCSIVPSPLAGEGQDEGGRCFGGRHKQHWCRPHAGAEPAASPQRYAVKANRGRWRIDRYVRRGAGVASRAETHSEVLAGTQASTDLRLKRRSGTIYLGTISVFRPPSAQQRHCNACHRRSCQQKCQGCGQITVGHDERDQGGNCTQRYRSIKRQCVVCAPGVLLFHDIHTDCTFRSSILLSSRNKFAGMIALPRACMLKCPAKMDVIRATSLAAI